MFKTGEEVTINYAGDDGPPAPPITREIVGFYDNGFLVKDPSDTYNLFIRSYAIPAAISLDTDQTELQVGPPVCFTKGTSIDTSDGHTLIENLKAGIWLSVRKDWAV